MLYFIATIVLPLIIPSNLLNLNHASSSNYPFAVNALYLRAEDSASQASTTQMLAGKLLNFFPVTTNETPPHRIGLLPKPPYYWWESGAAWGGLLDYARYTGDNRLNSRIMEGMVAQLGEKNDFMIPDHRGETGNDDQGFWALSAMSAAENGFPNPPNPLPSWSQIVQNVFNSQVARWDTATCNGGLRWQIFPENAYGYDYKNSVSNGALFQMAARLARYTGNQTYEMWSEKVWTWMRDTNLLTSNFEVYDGADVRAECKKIDPTQWSYNAGIFLYGASMLENAARARNDPQKMQIWQARVSGILDHVTRTFFTSNANATGVMFEQACEPKKRCNVDQKSFKAYLARWMGKTAVTSPWAAERINALLKRSAEAAAGACGGPDSLTCQFSWIANPSALDPVDIGVGEQLSALEIVQSVMATKYWQPRTESSPNPPNFASPIAESSRADQDSLQSLNSSPVMSAKAAESTPSDPRLPTIIPSKQCSSATGPTFCLDNDQQIPSQLNTTSSLLVEKLYNIIMNMVQSSFSTASLAPVPTP